MPRNASDKSAEDESSTAGDRMTQSSTLQSLAPYALQNKDLMLELVEFAPHRIHKVPTYFFRMVHIFSGDELGEINLRVGSTPHIERYAGHIGYKVHPAHRGHRYAARSLRLLIPLARSLQLDPLWITCDPGNIASRRTCEIAGATLIEVVDVPETCIIYRNGHVKKCRYSLSGITMETQLD
jgi:predicted acetyltransferase